MPNTSTGTTTTPGVALVDRADNTVMLRTFSKIYGLAGLRLGWVYCPPAIVDVMNRVRGPFNVVAPAQAAGVAALEDLGASARARAPQRRWLPWLAARLTALGLERDHPSVGNFVLADFPTSRATESADAAVRLPADRAASWRARWAATACRTACASRSAPRRRCETVVDAAGRVHEGCSMNESLLSRVRAGR